jgi:hypothetical protein
LYGLKQFLWAWYQCLDNHLVFQGFQRFESNVNIYIKKQVSFGYVIPIIYVDDHILINNKLTLIKQTKSILKKKFDMMEDENFHYTLSNVIICN